MSRAREMRAQRRAAQFAKFRITELNLVPLVDTFVSIVFFALTTATVGELAPVVPGVRLPESRVGATALQQLTLGIGPQVTLAGHRVMSTVEAARARSNDPKQPLLIPQLYSALEKAADSIRTAKHIPPDTPLETPLAIQGDRSMRYDLLARMMQTARLAGFKNLSLQVSKTAGLVPAPTKTASASTVEVR
ncbi:MAG TPA: biopolymer transporter ExbD [Gemmatimonadaceae bacterium]